MFSSGQGWYDIYSPSSGQGCYEMVSGGVGPYLSGKLILGPDQRGHGPGCFALRVDVAPSLPLRREVGAALGFGWRLSGIWLAFGGSPLLEFELL